MNLGAFVLELLVYGTWVDAVVIGGALLTLGGLLAYGAVVMIDYACARTLPSIRGTVHLKSYTPASTGTGIGPTVTGQGSGVAVTVTSMPEAWTVLVMLPHGMVEPITVTRLQWEQAVIGTTVELSRTQGYLSRAITYRVAALRGETHE